MTLRAVILGFVGAILLCGYTHFNDFVLHQTLFIGNHLPYSVYGSLIIFLLVINPLIYYVTKKYSFTGRELAVVLAFMLVACVIPGSGLMTTFTTSLMMPHHFNRTDPGWQKHKPIEMVPAKMVADISEDEDARLNGFVQGLSVGNKHIGLGDVPWAGWTRTLAFWVPIILVFWVALIALSVVVHKQWSEHEHLPYPIAEFAHSLLPGEGERFGSVFRNRFFLVGAGVVLLIHLNNYAFTWFPDLVRLPTAIRLGPLRSLFPSIERGGAWWFFHPKIFFTVIAFSYFLSTSVSFSLGFGTVLFAYLAGMLAGYGISLRGGGWFDPSYQRMLTGGAYIGLMGATLYTGRRYYLSVMKRSLNLRAQEDIEPHVVWAGRIFLGALLVFVLQLIIAGLDWQISLFYAVVGAGIFLVMSRIAAETGIFFIQPLWAPCVLMVGLFGASAFGPRTMAIMFMVSTVLFIDPREALMPFVVNALKILDLRKVKLGKPAAISGVVLLVGLAVAIPATLYFQYDRASHMTDRWTYEVFPRYAHDNVVKTKIRLEAQGSLEESNAQSGFARLFSVTFDGPTVFCFVLGVVLVMGTSIARWRVPWWPLHPILFLTWHPSAPNVIWFSLLVGCLIKFVVMKYGGEKLYQKGKPLMFGLIAGDMLGGIVPSIIGLLYYLITGEVPKAFSVTPG